MKKLVIGVVAIIVVVAAAYFGLGLGAADTAAANTNAAEATGTAEPVKAADTVVSEAKVVPVRSALLSVVTGGTVAEVPVVEGDQVTEGQVLVKLESARQAAAVVQAQAGLQRAQAQLDQLKAGAREQEVAAAKAGLEAAEAHLAQLKQGAKAEDIAAAEAALAAAKSAQASAEATLVALREKPRASDVKTAELALEQARNTLWATQVERDGICGPTTESYQCKAAEARVGAAWTAVNNAGETLKKAQEPATAEDLRAAEEGVTGAIASVSSAEAKLGALRRGPTATDIGAAEAEVRRAKAQFELVASGARSEAIAAAEADVEAARGALEAAKAALAETEVRAPFGGTVVTVGAKKGEQVGPGSVVVRIADLSGWKVETTDLTELSVVNVKEGNEAVVTIDAISGLELPGRVEQVKMHGENLHGDITYTVIVVPEQMDERLKWNMTASVSIKTK